MSEAHYKFGGLRFWNEREIMLRDHATARLAHVIQTTLRDVNKAWSFQRVEGPILTPRARISSAYDGDDVWLLQASLGDGEAVLRPETTPSSYICAEHLIKSGAEKMPLCVWQSGKSFRRETNDGASASKLRFYEFYQLEFQCIYAPNTKADYRHAVRHAVEREIGALTGKPTRIVTSDRLPTYSQITEDVEVLRPGSSWTEMCSISTRTDFENAIVLEVAIGLDRLVSVMGEGE